MKRAVIRLFGRILSVVGLGASYDTMATLVFDGHLSRRAYAATCTNSNGEVLSYRVKSNTVYYKACPSVSNFYGPFAEVAESASKYGSSSYQPAVSEGEINIPGGHYVILSDFCNPGVTTGYGELWDGRCLYSSNKQLFLSLNCKYVNPSDVNAGATGATGTGCYYSEAFFVPTVCYTFDSCAAGATRNSITATVEECVKPLVGERTHNGERACYMTGVGLCERSAPVHENCEGSSYYTISPFFGSTTGAGCYPKSNAQGQTGWWVAPACTYAGGGGSSSSGGSGSGGSGECYDVETGVIVCSPADGYLNSFFSGALPAGSTVTTCMNGPGYYCPDGTGANAGCWYYGNSNCYGSSCVGASNGFCSGLIKEIILESLDEAALASGTGSGTAYAYKYASLSSGLGTGCNQIVYYKASDGLGDYEYLGACQVEAAFDAVYGASGTGNSYAAMGTVRICPDGTSYVVSLEE